MKTLSQFMLIISMSMIIFMTSCNTDPCENSLCLNGGLCVDGSCDCPDQFEGRSCADQRTPDKVNIRTIQVTRFPGFNHDAEWDTGNGPDLYFRLYEGDDPLAQPLIAMEDADATLDYHFFIDFISMRKVMEEHTIQLRDYDPDDADDFMGEVKFVPYHMTNGFPSVIVIDDGGPVAFTLEVEYIYLKE